MCEKVKKKKKRQNHSDRVFQKRFRIIMISSYTRVISHSSSADIYFYTRYKYYNNYTFVYYYYYETFNNNNNNSLKKYFFLQNLLRLRDNTCTNIT